MYTTADILQTRSFRRDSFPAHYVVRGQPQPSRSTYFLLLFLAVSVLVVQAQTFTVVSDLSSSTKLIDKVTLVQGIDGNFYGISTYGGSHGTANL